MCVATGFYNKDKPIQPGKDHLHDGVILLLRPEFTAMLCYYENYGYCCFVPIGITWCDYERKNIVNSGQNDAILQMAYFKFIFRLSLLKILLF